MKAKEICVTPLVLYVLLSFGCALGTSPTDPVDAGGGVDDPVEWRLVYVGWDDNELASPIASDIQEIIDADLPTDLFTTIVVRDTGLVDGEIEIIVPGDTRRETVDLPRSPTLFDAGTLATVREHIDRSYPARGEIVVFAGHGRGWRGVGMRSGVDSLVATPTALARFLPPVENEIPRLVVVDAGYGAVGEVLFEFASGCSRVVATTSARDNDGIDFESVGSALRSIPIDRMGEIEEIGAAFFDAFESHAPTRTVYMTGEELTSLGDTIIASAAAVTDQISSYESQTAAQTSSLAAAIIPELPGEAFIPLDALTDILAIPPPPRNGGILLHLVSLDELGVPIGHDDTYRRGSEDTAIPPLFAELPWAPDLARRRGLLFDLWYRQF
jgi:hypothetical protein